MQKIALAAAIALSMLSTAAVAQTAEEQNLCMNDAFKVCGHTIPDRTRTIACMVQNKSQLSSGCQTVMDKYASQLSSPAANAYAAPAQAEPAPVRTTRNVSMKPMKTATNTGRPGKPLNILMR